MMSRWQMMFTYFLFLFCPSEVGSQSVTIDTINSAVDLLFLIDGSNYISERNFSTILTSVANFVESLPIGPSEVHVAALSYSVVVDRLDFTTNKTEAKRDILTLFYDGQAALTHIAFEEAFTVMNSRHSLRPEARRVVILVTESFARYPLDSRRGAERLLELGVEVWAVGIGPYIRQLELIDYTRRLDRTILWDRFDVLPPISLGLSGSVSPVVSVTDSPAATPRIQPSTAFSLFFTLEDSIKPTPTTLASPGTTESQSITWLSATTSTSATPTATSNKSAILGYSTASLAPTTTDRVPSVSLYSTAFLAPTTTDRVAIVSLYSTYMSLAPTGTLSNLSTLSGLATDVPSSTATISSSITAVNHIVTPTAVYPTVTPTAVNPSLMPTAMNPSLVPTAVNPTDSTLTSLAPSPTQTAWLASSTTAVDDPRNNTTTDDKLGDNSVLFNSLDTDGLCYKAVASNGFGFAPHPSDCDKFLQCHRSEGGAVTASIRLCPRGQFWKQANLTCVSSDQACCQDPCENRCDGQTFRMDGGCGRYWECWKGVSMARRCPLFQAYIPGKGCVFMPTCVDADKSTGSCHFSGKCESLPLRNNSGYRIQTLSGPFDFTCWASTEFDLASCSCRPQKTLSTCCHLVTLLNMASDIVTNTSAISKALAQAGCPATQLPDNQAKASTTNCSKDQSTVSDPMRDVTLHFQYLTSNSSPGLLPQVLVRSRACVPEQGGILVVSEDASSLDVKVISSTGYVLKASLPLLALNKTAWWDIHVHHTKGDLFLELTAESLVYSVYSKGGPHIPIGACGWTVGVPEELSEHLSKLTGNITDVLVSRCDEYGF